MIDLIRRNNYNVYHSRNHHVSVFTTILVTLAIPVIFSKRGVKWRENEKREAPHGRPSRIRNPQRRMMHQNMSKKCQNARRDGGRWVRIESRDDPSNIPTNVFVEDGDLSRNPPTKFFILPFAHSPQIRKSHISVYLGRQVEPIKNTIWFLSAKTK